MADDATVDLPAPAAPDVSGIRVLITGATNGLGLAMAEALAAAGARVLVSGRSTLRIDEALQRVRAAAADTDAVGGGAAVGINLDVRDEESIAAGVREAAEVFDGLDVLVNNAGLGMRSVNRRFQTEPGRFWDVSPDGFRAVIDTNLTGYFLVARAAVAYLRASSHGRIVNVSMNEATMRRRGFVPYGPSRAGTDALSHIMAADLADFGVGVNLLLPGGATATGMIPDEVEPDVRSKLLPPSVMGPPIVWLCSTAADGVTDERIVATEWDAWLAGRA
jgi:NAD(P)-dependent dehydrogenase (short-subunit alcohol dehydrogenase family)